MALNFEAVCEFNCYGRKSKNVCFLQDLNHGYLTDITTVIFQDAISLIHIKEIGPKLDSKLGPWMAFKLHQNRCLSPLGHHRWIVKALGIKLLAPY